MRAGGRRRPWLAGAVVTIVLLLLWGWHLGRSPAAERPPPTSSRVQAAVQEPPVPPPTRDAGWSPHREDAGDAAAQAEAPDAPALAACENALRQALDRRAHELESSAQPRDRIAAALIARWAGRSDWQRAHADYGAALATVQRSSSDEPLGLWLQANACPTDAGCDNVAATSRLVGGAPENSAAWVLAINARMQQGDLDGAEAALARAAHAAQFDLHWGETAQLVHHALRGLAVPECQRAGAAIGRLLALDRPGSSDDLLVVGMTGVLEVPALHHLLALCPPPPRLLARRAATCRAVFEQMANARELLPYLLGTQRLALTAPTAAERRRWTQRWREAQWLQERGGKLFKPTLAPLAWEQGEVAVIQALLEERGEWPPPRDWRPGRDR